jgi:hypothetical protein
MQIEAIDKDVNRKSLSRGFWQGEQKGEKQTSAEKLTRSK